MKLFYDFKRKERGQVSIEVALWGTFILMIAISGKEFFQRYSQQGTVIQQKTQKELLAKHYIKSKK